MKKIVISGSVKLQNELKTLFKNLKSKYEILDYPKIIDKDKFLDEYPDIHKTFYKNITNTDVFLLFNHNLNGLNGYIGSAGFAELAFAITQNLIYGKSIEIYIYKMPDEHVNCYKEVSLWLNYGWLKIWDKDIK